MKILDKLKKTIEAEWAFTIVLIFIIIVSITALGYSLKIKKEISDKYQKTIEQNQNLTEENSRLQTTHHGLSQILIRQHETLEHADKIIGDLIKKIKKLEDLNRFDINKIL